MQKLRIFITDKDGKLVLWQSPNVPLIGWFIFFLLAKLAPSNNWHVLAASLSTAFLLVWSILEIGWGVNYFRRVLGLVVLTILIVSRL